MSKEAAQHLKSPSDCTQASTRKQDMIYPLDMRSAFNSQHLSQVS